MSIEWSVEMEIRWGPLGSVGGQLGWCLEWSVKNLLFRGPLWSVWVRNEKNVTIFDLKMMMGRIFRIFSFIFWAMRRLHTYFHSEIS